MVMLYELRGDISEEVFLHHGRRKTAAPCHGTAVFFVSGIIVLQDVRVEFRVVDPEGKGAGRGKGQI